MGDDLRILFCGINPGRLSGTLGQHFAHPGNRFWKALHLSGLTPVQLGPATQERLLEFGLGITNLVERATATASDLSAAELRAGVDRLEAKVHRHRPAAVAVLGVGAYRTAFRRPRAPIGFQHERLGEAELWILANPSGLQARYGLDELTTQFEELRLGSAHRRVRK